MLNVVAGSLGNLDSFDVAHRRLERIALESDALAKRVLRFETSRGDLGVRLPGNARLMDGDVLYADEFVVIAVEVLPDDVLVCRPHSISQALLIAHALGNRHVPVHVEGDALVVGYDRLWQELAYDLGVPHARERRTLRVPLRHADAPHAHVTHRHDAS